MPETTTEPQELTFHWRKPVAKARSLAFWMFAVLLGLAGFFYLFQVVYPQAQRFTPVPHHVVALNAADPAVREIMNRVQDRDFLILPPATEAAGEVSLDEHSPLFHPTFEGHKLQLQDLPQRTFAVPAARLLQMDEPVLPPLDLSELKPAPSVVKPVANASRVTMRLAGPLALRAILQPPDLASVVFSDAATCRYQLGVNADGVVDVALPLSSSEGLETMEKLNRVMQNIRFAPAATKSSMPVWGTATFEWSPATP